MDTLAEQQNFKEYLILPQNKLRNNNFVVKIKSLILNQKASKVMFFFPMSSKFPIGYYVLPRKDLSQSH